MKPRSLAICAGLITLVAACGGGAATSSVAVSPATQSQAVAATQSAPGTQSAEATQQAGASNAAATGTGSKVHLVVGSGPLAGTYDTSGPKTDCNISSTGSGATFVDVNATTGISSATFSAIEGGASPKAFYFQVLMAPVTVLNAPEFSITTLTPSATEGSGTASLTDNGATIIWSIDGTTKDNIPVTATIECGPVDRS